MKMGKFDLYFLNKKREEWKLRKWNTTAALEFKIDAKEAWEVGLNGFLISIFNSETFPWRWMAKAMDLMEICVCEGTVHLFIF